MHGAHWIISLFGGWKFANRWRERAIAAEKTVDKLNRDISENYITCEEHDHWFVKCNDELAKLKDERRELFTGAEVDKHVAVAVESKQRQIDELKCENERYLESLSDIRESLVGIPAKNEKQSYLSIDDPL